MREGASAGPRTARKVGALLGALFLVLVVIPLSVWLAVADDGTPTNSDAGTTTSGAVATDAERSSRESDGRARRERSRSKAPLEPPRAPEVDAAIGHADDTRGGAVPATSAADSSNPAEALDPKLGGRGGPGSEGARSRRSSSSGSREETGVLVVEVKAAESGEPIVGAEVLVRSGDDPPRRVATQHDGRAHFFVPVGALADVEAKAPRRVRAWKDRVAVRAGETVLPIPLDRGIVVVGRVSGPKGGLRDARVRAFRWDEYRASLPFAPEPRPVETTTTGRGGRYELDCLPRGTTCCVLFDAEDFAVASERVKPQPDPDFVVRRDVSLDRAAFVSGFVFDAKRTPLPGTWVYAFRGAEVDFRRDERFGGAEIAMLFKLRECVVDAYPDFGISLPPRARTNADGRYRLALPETWGLYRVIAMHDDLGRSRPSDALRVSADAQPLVAPGRVVRAEFSFVTAERQPAGGLRIQPWFPWERWQVSEQPGAVYGYANVDGGPIAMLVTGAAGAPGVYVGRRASSDSVRWKAELLPGNTWIGTVRDDRGTPVAGATVKAGPIAGATDDDGAFTLRGIHPLTVQLKTSAPGHVDDITMVSNRDENALRVVLPRASLVRFQLELPRGTPEPAWFRVAVGSSKWPWWPESLGTDRLSWDDGVVELGHRNLTDDRIVVFVPGCRVLELDVPARPGESTDLGAAKLLAAGWIAGEVVDDAGAPASGATVSFRLASTSPLRDLVPAQLTRCGADGRFQVRLPVLGEPAEFLAEAPQYAATPMRFRPLAELQRIVLARGTTFSGQWRGDLEGAAFARLLDADGTTLADVPLDDRGRFETDVARRPAQVEIHTWRGRSSTHVVRSSLPDGEVFRFP